MKSKLIVIRFIELNVSPALWADFVSSLNYKQLIHNTFQKVEYDLLVVLCDPLTMFSKKKDGYPKRKKQLQMGE